MSNPLFVVINLTRFYNMNGTFRPPAQIPDTRQSWTSPGFGPAPNSGIHHRVGTIQTSYESRVDHIGAVWRRIRTNSVWFIATARPDPTERRVWLLPVTNIQPRVRRTVRQAINVRRGPGTAYPIVRSISPGTHVTPTHRCTPASSLGISTLAGAWVRIGSREWIHESTANFA